MNRYENTKKVGLLGIGGNLFLLIIKFMAAFISHSQAMLADAINSAGDIFSSLMTYIGNKIASVPSDEDHNFGHGKAEYIFSFIISIFMIVIAFVMLINSILSIINHDTIIFSYGLIIVCIITILVKFLLYLYAKNSLKKHQNILIKATMNDHKNDMFLTMGTLLSIILSEFGLPYFDGIIGALISIYIIITGISIFLESYKILMDISIDKAEKEDIINFILEHDKVENVRDFYTVATGYKYIAILTIDVDGTLDTFTTHNIADKLEIEVTKKFRKVYKVIIHVNPV